MREKLLTILIIAKNEEAYIGDCLKSARWADEVVLMDTGSTDKTIEIAKRMKVKILSNKFSGGLQFAKWRMEALSCAKSKWVLYLDADERITPELKDEINLVTKSSKCVAYSIPRRNFLLGKELHHGGWWPDYVKRLFLKESLKGWKGSLHEEPIINGHMGYLSSPMIHLQPETIEPMFQKTIVWSRLEAKLLFDSNHPQVAWWRVIRMGVTTLFDRLIKKQGFRDGVEGVIESFFQAFHYMIVYIQLWEMQMSSKNNI